MGGQLLALRFAACVSSACAAGVTAPLLLSCSEHFSTKLVYVLPIRAAVENAKSFEEQHAERAIEVDRYLASDTTNSVHQMWVFDRQTLLVTRPKK